MKILKLNILKIIIKVCLFFLRLAIFLKSMLVLILIIKAAHLLEIFLILIFFTS